MKGRANRVVIATRATPSTPNHGTPGTSLIDRVQHVAPLRTGGRNRKCKKSTPVQRNSVGRRSEWTMGQDFWTDPRWSRTVSDG